MSSVEVAVSVPLEDAADLERLFKSMQAPGAAMESRSLDGETVLTALLLVTTGSLGVFRAWLLARSAERRGCLVRIDGNTYRGYSSEEVIALLSAVRAKLPDEAGIGESAGD
jgi:hypothetical protein